LLVSTFLSVRLNFFRFTDEKEPYVYVQTYPEIETLTGPLLEMAKKDPRYYHVRGQIILESYYPLPWMLGDFTQIGYYKKEDPPDSYDADVIVAQKDQMTQIEAGLATDYYKRTFRLRDSQEECVAYFREKTYQEYFQEAPPVVRRQP
jgi:hypothetical protein